MGINGPLPLSKEELKKRGSWRSEVVKNHPDPKRGQPECPTWLPWQARNVWDRVVPMLDEMGILAKVDQDAITLYCIQWIKWREAEEFILKNGQTYESKKKFDKKGNVVSVEFRCYPQVNTAYKLADQLSKMEKELCLTPLARARMNIQPPAEESKEKNDKLRFLRSGGT